MLRALKRPGGTRTAGLSVPMPHAQSLPAVFPAQKDSQQVGSSFPTVEDAVAISDPIPASVGRRKTAQSQILHACSK
jgi:hypothetical protein